MKTNDYDVSRIGAVLSRPIPGSSRVLDLLVVTTDFSFLSFKKLSVVHLVSAGKIPRLMVSVQFSGASAAKLIPMVRGS